MVHPAEARPGLKEAAMLVPFGVASKGSKMGDQHVHQPVVSHLRHPRLRVRSHRIPGRPSDLHHQSRPQDLPLLGLWRTRGPATRSGRAPFPSPAHRQPGDDPGPAHPRVQCLACGVVRQVEIPFADPRVALQAEAHGQQPRSLSFKEALQTISRLMEQTLNGKPECHSEIQDTTRILLVTVQSPFWHQLCGKGPDDR